MGFDPEMGKGEQIIKEVKFIPIDRLMHFTKGSLHQMFNDKAPDYLDDLKGYFLSAE